MEANTAGPASYAVSQQEPNGEGVEASEGERQGRWRGLRRGRRRQMQFFVENEDREGQGDG